MTNTFLKVLFSICLLSLSGNVFAQAPEAQLAEALSAYQEGDYQKSISLYEGLIETGIRSGDLYYNLGLAYLKSEAIAPAILAFKRGQRLSPMDSDIRSNIEIALGSTQNELYPLPPFFLSKWWQGWFQLASVRAWTILSLVFLYGSIALFLWWMLAQKSANRKKGFIAGSIVLLFALVFYLTGISRSAWQLDQDEAVLMINQASLHAGPDEMSGVVREVYAGLLVEVIGFEGPWYKVRLRNGEEGWLDAADLKRI